MIRRAEDGNYKETELDIRKRRRDRGKLRKLTESFRVYFHVVVIIFETDGSLYVCVRQHWQFNLWSAAYLGDLCLIAGTVIRSGDCSLSSAYPWLCCFEP